MRREIYKCSNFENSTIKIPNQWFAVRKRPCIFGVTSLKMTSLRVTSLSYLFHFEARKGPIKQKPHLLLRVFLE